MGIAVLSGVALAVLVVAGQQLEKSEEARMSMRSNLWRRGLCGKTGCSGALATARSLRG